MAEPYDNTNTGALFKNDKGDNPKRPDYKGKINVGGVEFRVSGWIKEMKSGGGKFMSLKLEQEEAQQPKAAAVSNEHEGEDIPF